MRMQTRFWGLCLCFCLGFGKLEAEQVPSIYKQFRMPANFWLYPEAVPVNLLDSTLAHKFIDTLPERYLRYVLYRQPLSGLNLSDYYGTIWKLDRFGLKNLYKPQLEQVFRNQIYGSRWGVNPYEPFSQVQNMLSLHHIRDTSLLRKRRGKYIRLKEIRPVLKTDMVQATNIIKPARKPLINPKDSVRRWTFDITTGINMAQLALVNWAAGGESSVSGNGRFKMNIAYRRGGHKWETKLHTEYGLIYRKTDGLNKTVDNLLVSTRYGYAIPGGRFYYTVFAEFQTQYDRGYANIGDKEYISAFLSPAYLNLSVGMEYKLAKLLSVYLAPLNGRNTIVNDDFLARRGAFGVDSGKHVKWEIGLMLTTALEWRFRKNMVIKTDASFFTPYDKSFGNIVVDWNVGLDMYITKLLKATISTSLKYDDKVKTVDANGNEHGPKVQFREMVTLGIGYTFRYKSKQIES